MIDEAFIRQVDSFLSSKNLWINSSDSSGGEIVLEEFFLIKIRSVFFVGFDKYQEKYEDATDLYEFYIREEFQELTPALEFIFSKLPMTKEKISKNVIFKTSNKKS
jgi:hypothetical protein